MRVGQVLIVGAEKVDTGTVRRMLSVRAGEWFRQDQLYLTQRDLYGLGMFRSVNVVLADTTPPPGASTVRVVVRVSEAPRHRIRAGAGYGSLDCFRVQSGWTAYDFLGGARSLDLTGQLSKLGVGVPANSGFKQNVCHPLHDDPTSDTANYNATLTLRQPAFLSPRHTASFAVFAERRSEFKAYTRQAVAAKHSPQPRRSALAWRIRGGTILPQRLSLLGQSTQFVPPDQRFYAGGPNSVRGYARNGLGPRVYVTDSIIVQGTDTTLRNLRASPTGGNTVVTANLELRVPTPIFPDRVRLGLFVDVGQVWERGDTLSAVSGLRVTPGLGLRFITPLGPVRLDAAYNGYPQEPGPLYLLDNTNKSLTAVLDPTGKQLLLRPRLPGGFWRRGVA